MPPVAPENGEPTVPEQLVIGVESDKGNYLKYRPEVVEKIKQALGATRVVDLLSPGTPGEHVEVQPYTQDQLTWMHGAAADDPTSMALKASNAATWLKTKVKEGKVVCATGSLAMGAALGIGAGERMIMSAYPREGEGDWRWVSSMMPVVEGDEEPTLLAAIGLGGAALIVLAAGALYFVTRGK
jgi:hypothetical protein